MTKVKKFKAGQCWRNEEAVIIIVQVSSDGTVIKYQDLVTQKESDFYYNSGFANNLKLLNKLEQALYNPIPKGK